MAQNSIQMPGVFGGLMRFNEEFQSRFMVTPAQVLGFIVAIILFVVVLKMFFPPAISDATAVPGFVLPLLGLKVK